MNIIKKSQFIFILLLCMAFVSQNAFSQSTVFFENFEGATTMQYTNPTNPLDGLTNWGYEKTSTGQLRFNITSNSGSYSALLDSYSSGTYAENYLIKTVNIFNATNVTLSFYFADYGDETSAAYDVVWVRGSNVDPWVVLYSLNPGATTNGVWNYISGLDVSAALTGAGQTPTSTFQIRFGQYDNFPHPTDGIAFDDIELMGILPGIAVTNIDHEVYSSCTDAAASVEVTFTNTSGSDHTGFDVDYSIDFTPEGGLQSPQGTWTTQYSGTLTDNTTSNTGNLTLTNLDFSQYGEYVITVQSDIASEANYSMSKTLYFRAPLSIPLNESFNGTQDNYWGFGDNFMWNQGSGWIQANINNAQDTLTTPAITVSVDQHYFNYNFNFFSLGATDTILVQLGTACSGNFSTIDTIINDGDPDHYGLYNTYTDQWAVGRQLTNPGTDVQLRFVASTHSNANLYLNEISVTPGNDLRVVPNGILLDPLPTVTNDQYQLQVIVQNMGHITQSSISANIEIYGETTTTLSGTLGTSLAYGEVDTINMGTFNGSLPGIYEIGAKVVVPRDDNDANDTESITIELDEIEELTVDISTTFDDYNWAADQFTVNTNSLNSSTIGIDDEAEIASFKMGPVVANSYFTFSYLVNSDTGNELGTGDVINLYFSTNSGQTYTNVLAINRANHVENTTAEYITPIDLTPYIGQDLVFKVEVIKSDVANETNWMNLVIEDVYVGPAKLQINDILHNVGYFCGVNPATVWVAIENASPVPANAFDVNLEITADNFSDVSAMYSSTGLNPGELDTVVLGTNFNLSLHTTYQTNSFINYAESLVEFDDEIEVRDVEPLDYLDEFDVASLLCDGDNNCWINTLQGTETHYWLSSGNVNWYDNTNSLAVDLTEGDNTNLSTAKLGPITAGAYLTFEYRIDTYDDAAAMVGNYLRTGDEVYLYLSNDCGATWNLEHTLSTTHVDTDVWQSISNIDLSAYEGDNIRAEIRIAKTNTLGSMTVVLNKFQVLSAGDAGVVEVNTPQYTDGVAVCGVASDVAEIKVKNFGIGTIDAVPVVLDVVFENNEDTTRLTGTTGVIPPGDTATISISGFNTEQYGAYQLIGYSVLDGDLNDTNDEFAGGLTVQSIHMLPWNYDGNSSPGDWQYFDTQEAGWSSATSIEGSPFEYLATPMLNEAEEAYVTLQKVGPINAGYELLVKYNVFAYDNNDDFIGNYLRSGDVFDVMISNDCGATYTSVVTMNSANQVNNSEDTTLVINLDAYAGDNISVKLMVTKGSTIGKLRVGVDMVDFTIPQADVALNSVFVEDGICGKAAEPVYAVITNNDSKDATGFTITADILDNEAGNTDVMTMLSYTYSGTLPAGETDTIEIGTFDSQMMIEYKIEAMVSLADDINTFNDDATTTFKIWEIMPNNYKTDFAWGGMDMYDMDEGWKYDDNTSYDGSSALESNEVIANSMVELYSPKFEALANNSMLVFDYDLTGGEFGIGDEIQVYYSTDCGANYTMLGAVDNAENLSTFDQGTAEFSLSAIAGEQVQFLIRFNNQNDGSYWMEIDNFAISVIDVAAIGVVTETDIFDIDDYNENSAVFNFAERYITCGDAADDIWVVIENKGSYDLTTVDVTLDYNGKASGQLTGTFTGVLEPGKRTVVAMGTLDTETPGLLDMRVTAATANDAVADNNIIGFSTTTQATYAIPYDAFSNPSFNEGYYWDYDNDGFMQNQAWVLGNWVDLGAANLDKGDTAFAVTPKLLIDGAATLYFDYNVANSLGEGHIIHDELGEVLISTDCGATWTQVWSIDVTDTDFGPNGTIAVDLSANASTNGNTLIMFRAVKGYSDGLFSISFDDIHIESHGPVEVTGVDAEGNALDLTQDIVACEGSNLMLSAQWVNGFNYTWLIDNGTDVYEIGWNSNLNYTLAAEDNGQVILNVSSGMNDGILYSQSYNITVSPLPSEPTIAGHDEVVSNVQATLYTATADNADNYHWDLSTGGSISGMNDVGTADWWLGYIGYTDVMVRGENACGLGPWSEPFQVYVEFLDPGHEGTGKQAEVVETTTKVTVFPNPSIGQVNIDVTNNAWEGATYSITNNTGLKVVDKVELTGEKTEVTLNRVPGNYYLTITTQDGNNITRTIIIE